jgi:hypothetical protein
MVTQPAKLFGRRRWPFFDALIDNQDAVTSTVHFQVFKLHLAECSSALAINAAGLFQWMDFFDWQM